MSVFVINVEMRVVIQLLLIYHLSNDNVSVKLAVRTSLHMEGVCNMSGRAILQSSVQFDCC